MASLGSDTHSFIIKIWVEEIVDETKPVVWRGHITHVPDGERQYLNNLPDIQRFIAPYLKAMGAEVGKGKWRQWIKRGRDKSQDG
ncbi:MAG: hypothetical protein JNM09_27360 [Blastocatellia bacterium]|nr:hypothetical protein [Blastocatellia bacterium]